MNPGFGALAGALTSRLLSDESIRSDRRRLAWPGRDAAMRTSGIMFSVVAATGVAAWTGILFEREIQPESVHHVTAVCFGLAAIAAPGWMFLLSTGLFRGKAWATTLACALPFVPPMVWALPLVAGMPGFLIYRIGKRASR
jgi:hypothetical protein